MEFDTNTLTPKYVLHVGSPGRSMAIEMARQLGLPEALIKDATSQLSASELKMDALLADAEQARGRAKNLEAEAEKAKDEAGLLRNTLQRQVEDLASRRRGLEREAKESCRKMTAQARREIETLLDRSRKSAASEGVRKALKRVESLEDGWTEKVEPQTPPARDLSPGSRIWVNSLGVPAELVTIMSNGRAIVERRGVRVEVPVSELREFEVPLREKKASGGYSAPAPAEGIAEILLLGLAGDEAVEAVERQIDAALLQGVNEMKIIHGKGTGVLRKRISNLLSEHLAVKSFRLGEIWEGGSGVTIVRLK
jgi:DNA mismatch repair protein MutS2